MKIQYLTVICLLLLLSGCGFQQQIPDVERMADIPYPYPTRSVTLDSGIEIAYMDEGRGDKTVLMIHGLGSYGPAWKKNIEVLRGEFRCIAVDLPGYGKSSKGKYEGSMRFYADVIHTFARKLNLENVTLMGHSMGGQISITTALAYPEMFKELVLIAPAGFETFHAGQRDWFRNVLSPRAVALTSVDQIKTNIGANFFHMPRDAEFMVYDRIAMRKCVDFPGYCYIIPQNIQGMVDDPVFEYLPNLKARTLVIFGEQDNLIPNPYLNGGKTADVARQGVERIPGADLQMIDHAGHFVHFEKADEVNPIIAAFLEGE